MVELSEYRMDAFRLLDGLMDSFTSIDGEREFICPMLEHFWPRLNQTLLPDKRLEGVLVLQDWGNLRQSSEEAIANVIHARTAKAFDRQKSDRTLFNLFRPESEWLKPLTDGGWIAMNAVWGTRLKKDRSDAEKSECLPTKIHYPALTIWGKVILDLHQKCPFEKLVLAGSWARFVTPEKGGRVFESSNYFEKWAENISNSRIEKGIKEESRDVAEELGRLKGLRVHLADHPSTWKYGYTGQSGPP
jgi:hypothetical protein